MNITFNELRNIKDSLPDGSMQKIAQTLDISVETVRNYFGGSNYKKGETVGIHYEAGPNGGIVRIDHPEIIEMAKSILAEQELQLSEN